MIRFCLSSASLSFLEATKQPGADVQTWLGFPHGLYQGGRPSLDAMTSLMDTIVMRPLNVWHAKRMMIIVYCILAY